VSRGWNAWRALDRRTPVVVGVGRASRDEDALGLMIAAAHDAARDAHAPELLRRVDRVAVPQGTWPYRDAGRLVARAIGAGDARTAVFGVGIPQQALFDDAWRDLLAGRIDTALIVGGEAARRAADAKRAGVELVDAVAGDDRDPDERRLPEGEMLSRPELAAGLFVAAQQFAIIDSALRRAEERSLDEHRDEIARLWAGFSAAAGTFPHAAFRAPRSAEAIRDPGPDNRAIAFPYNKWHCSQMNVDQAAAILVTTLEAAEAAGLDPGRLIFPLVALESSFSIAMPRRRDLHRWPAMEVLGRAAAAQLGAPLSEIEHVELYSCFPAAVRVQQRALGLPVDGIPTITGGEPFAGGPWNNFVLQATVAMVERLRARPGERGLVTTVSGFLNKPGLAVYSSAPGDRGLLVADLADDAARATATVPLLGEHHGPATIVAYTVGYGRSGPERTIAIADTAGGARCLGISADPKVAERAMTEDLIGARVVVDGMSFEI
jgi:acetyl-CoA C-acetyltransferase